MRQLRQQVVDRGVHGEPELVDQNHRGRRDDRLGQRRHPEQGVPV
jgi:hypothetical protein